MKTLFLVRHAKSEWDNVDLKDIERPLNERGYSNANSMSVQFKSKYAHPDLILTSPAIRAISTALIFARNLNYNANTIKINQELYDTSVKEYIKVISQIDNAFVSVMLFAHNPTISELADSLTKSLPAEMTTCAIVGIQFNIDDWQDVKTKTGELFMFEYPKK